MNLLVQTLKKEENTHSEENVEICSNLGGITSLYWLLVGCWLGMGPSTLYYANGPAHEVQVARSRIQVAAAPIETYTLSCTANKNQKLQIKMYHGSHKKFPTQ